MEKQDHYYDDWKMENEAVLLYIQSGDKVLDIGCGRGGFIDKINKALNADVLGKN